jgi:hypothetical protein
MPPAVAAADVTTDQKVSTEELLLQGAYKKYWLLINLQVY